MDGEEDFVETLRSLDGTSSTLGDDCALLDGTDPPLLATVDSLNESVHFETSVPRKDIATKLVGVNMSDVAAMGGQPRWALLAEGSNEHRSDREEFVRYLTEILDWRGIELVGGDIGGVSSEENRFYSMTLVGQAHPAGVLERGAARPGDALAVTGTLGAPAAVRATSQPPWTEEERDWLYAPPHRVREGQQLLEAGVRCAIDLSDGLLKDLGRILRRSNAGACLDWTTLPVDPLAEDRGGDRSEILRWSLTGGEDFELLFTLPPDRSVPFDDYTVVGRITDEPGLNWDPHLPEGTEFDRTGYDHLGR